MKINLVYCHIGNSLPYYIYDCIYQSLITQKSNISLYILTNEKFINEIYNNLNKLNVSNQSCITVIPIELFKDSKMLKLFKNLNLNLDNKFRDGFWEHTTSRFIYLYEFMNQFKIQDVFHIENDVMIYCDLNEMYQKLKKLNYTQKIISVQDAPDRSICSFVYIPNEKEIGDFLEFCLKQLKKESNLNDMNLMGRYKNKNTFPDSPEHQFAKELGIFDGACIGQYLGGIDLRNIQLKVDNKYTNPTIGFINETAMFKPNTCNFHKTNDGKYILEKNQIKYSINCLHIHSKQLFNFSSFLPIKYNEIITGDRILDLVDLIFTTKEIFQFHKYSQNLQNKIIIVKDFLNISSDVLQNYIKQYTTTNKSNIVKIFCYTHLLEPFFNFILPKLNNDIEVILYTHNSDHEVNDLFLKYINDTRIKYIYSQNLNIIHPKAKLLPIGLANYQWQHGNLDVFYNVCIDNYYLQKSKQLYVNINKNTYSYRDTVLKNLDKCIIVSSNKTYEEYLKELSQYRFCLCVRGNGIDTHRFWESLYLGVIPVIIVNEHTKCDNFVENLRKLNVPFHCIKNISEIKLDIFTNELYQHYYKNLLTNFFILNLKHYRR